MNPTQAQQESTLTGHRFFLLFIFLLATLILFPYAEASHVGSYAFRVIGSFAIVVSVYAANVHRSLLIFAVLLAIPALFERIVLPKLSSHSFFIFNIFLTLVFDVMIVVIIFRHVLAERQPTSETIFGALCVYLLVGFTFASVYGMVAAFQPSAFYLDPRTNLHLVVGFGVAVWAAAALVDVVHEALWPVETSSDRSSLNKALTQTSKWTALFAFGVAAFAFVIMFFLGFWSFLVDSSWGVGIVVVIFFAVVLSAGNLFITARLARRRRSDYLAIRTVRR